MGWIIVITVSKLCLCPKGPFSVVEVVVVELVYSSVVVTVPFFFFFFLCLSTVTGPPPPHPRKAIFFIATQLPGLCGTSYRGTHAKIIL